MNTHCLIIQSLDTGATMAERILPDDPPHQEHAEEMVEAWGLMPGARWRWGVIEVADPGWARHADPRCVEWDPNEFTQRVEEDPEDTDT